MFERELYKLALGSNPLPIVLTDFNGNVLDASLGFALLLGVQRDDLVGVNLKDIIPVEIEDDLEVETSFAGEFYKVISQKYEVEGINFFVFSLYRVEQLKATPLSSLTDIRDVFEIGLKASTFPEFATAGLPNVGQMFGASSVLLVKRTKAEPGKFFIVFGTDESYKQWRDEVFLNADAEYLFNLGMPLYTGDDTRKFRSLELFVESTGYASGWFVPVGIDASMVDMAIILLFSDERTPSSEEYNILVYLSYLCSLVYQKTEYKKQFEALSYKDMVSETYSEVLIKEFIDLQCDLAKRYDIAFSVMMVRIENFDKMVNLFGLYRVENCISDIAKAIKSNLRKSDIIGRISKKVLAVILPFTDSSRMGVVVSRVINILRTGVPSACKNFKFTIGTTTYIEGDNHKIILERIEDLLEPVL